MTSSSPTRLLKELGTVSATLVLWTLLFGALAQQRSTVVTVTDRPPASNAEEYATFMDMVERFQAEHPDVEIRALDVYYDRDTFPAKLAGNTLETAFVVPFTDPQGLIGRNQVADITPFLEDWPFFGDLNPNVMRLFQDEENRVYGLPRDGYALGLVYNRKLFEEAGLDPDAPPTTWEEVREVARRLTDRDRGQAGFMQLSLDNGGGWMMIAYYYTFGGSEPVVQEDGRWVANFNNETALDVLRMLKAMRWEDNSLPDRVLLSYSDYTQLMASGRVGMMVYPASVIAQFAIQYGANVTDFGAGAMPQQGGNATLAGGSAFMFNPRAPEENLQAAVDWALFSLYDPENYERQLAALAEQGQPVGIPELSIFTGELQAERQAVLERYANVNLEYYRQFLESTETLELRPEPALDAQQLYAALDPAVQAVLTDPDADPQALLDQAERQFTATVLDPLNEGD